MHQHQLNLQMGNKPSDLQQEQKITHEQLELAVDYLTKNQSMYFTKIELKDPIMYIMLYVRQNDPFDHSSGLLKTSPALIKMFFHPSFPRQMMKVLRLFIQSLEDLNKKSFTFLKTHQIRNLINLANFIIFASNQKITSTFDSLLVRTDIDPTNKEMIKKMEEANEGDLQIIGSLTEKMPDEQKEGVQKILRVTIMNFINLRNQSFSPSSETLKYFSILEYSLFMLYTKIFFSVYSPDYHTPNQKQSFKSNLIIGAYFLSAGTSQIQPSVYEAAVVFLYANLRLPGIIHPQMKSLPSHYFKNLPVVTSSSLYDYVLCNTLFTLKYISEGHSFFIRFAFNRIFSLKLVQLLLKDTKSQNQISTYYLEQLCMQVKVGQIQRSCLCEVVKIYDKLNPDSSEVFRKFIENGNIKYNLKFADKQIKVNPIEVITELEDEKDTCSKEYLLINEKFLYERVFLKQLNFNINDRSLWSEILPGIMSNKEDEEIHIMSKLRGQENSSEGEQEQNMEQKRREAQDEDERKVNIQGKGQTQQHLQ